MRFKIIKTDTWKGFIIATIIFFIIGVGYLQFQDKRKISQLGTEMRGLKKDFEDIRYINSDMKLMDTIGEVWFTQASEHMDTDTILQLRNITYNYHKKYGSDGDIPLGLDYWRIFAWVELESGYDPQAVSYAGAVGLTQQMPITGIDGLDRYFGLRGLDRKQLMDILNDPIMNFRLGLRRLVEYQLGFMAAGFASVDDWKLSFSLYNWSIKAVSELIQAKKKGTPKASLKYAIEIESRIKKYIRDGQ